MADNKHDSVARRLKADIAGGKYVDRIPGIHALAKEYGVNFKTANKAVARLEDEGLVHTRRGEGRFVTQGEPAVAKKQVTVARKQDRYDTARHLAGNHFKSLDRQPGTHQM